MLAVLVVEERTRPKPFIAGIGTESTCQALTTFSRRRSMAGRSGTCAALRNATAE